MGWQRTARHELANITNLKGMRIAQGTGNVSVQLKQLLLQTAATTLQRIIHE